MQKEGETEKLFVKFIIYKIFVTDVYTGVPSSTHPIEIILLKRVEIDEKLLL